MNIQNGEPFCSELGSSAAFAQVDVTKAETIQAAVDQAVEKFGSIHILVNCAGIAFVMKTVEKDGPHDLKVFKQIIDINLIGTFDASRLVAFKMQDNKPNEEGERGVIVNCASIAALEGSAGLGVYTTSKAGVAGMTLTIARDLARSGIRCCSIAPGHFDTPMTAFTPDTMKEQFIGLTPFPKRYGNPSEFAILVQHIIENPFLNGETIRLDAATRLPPE